MEHLDTLRKICSEDLFSFAKYVNPHRLYGEIHKEVFKFLQSEDTGTNQLLLLPRSHMKSHCVATWVAWWLTKHPEATILYVSSTTTLAEAQLDAIKMILTSDRYRKLWPEMVHPEEGKRERWNSSSIKVDHPKRKEEGVRDASIHTAGLTSSVTGLHFDVTVFDDIVEPDNAYTDTGRRKVAAVAGQMSSIRNPGGFTKACGTRYHPKDIYGQWKDTKVPLFDDEGSITGERELWSIMEKAVEDDGIFLWPREARSDGQWYGFNQQVLEYTKAEYRGDMTQFYAQYYNDPNDPDSNRLHPESFEYYDLKHVKDNDDGWYYRNKKLNVYAAMDFAFSLSKGADFTAIVVIGIDCDGIIYVLDIDRFKTNKIKEYFSHAVRMHEKWRFRKLRAEVTAAQVIIVNDLKDEFRRNGRSIVVDDYRPIKNKEERISAILEPRYENKDILHFRGGYIGILEEELVLARPAHDDIKDALASAVEVAVKPKQRRAQSEKVIPISRFGGVRFRHE